MLIHVPRYMYLGLLRSRYKKGTKINVDVDMTTYIESYILSSFTRASGVVKTFSPSTMTLAEDFCVLLGQGLEGIDIDDTVWTGQRPEERKRRHRKRL